MATNQLLWALAKRVLFQIFVITATFLIGALAITWIPWPTTTNPLGITLALALWLLVIVVKAIGDDVKPAYIVESMAVLILMLRAWLPDLEIESSAQFQSFTGQYGVHSYSLNLGLIAVFCTVSSMIGANYLSQHDASWLSEKLSDFKQRIITHESPST